MNDAIIQLLTEIRDELRTLNARQKPRTRKESVLSDGLPELAIIWNEWAHESLPRVVSMETGSTRFKNCIARWNLKPEKNYWVGVIQRMNRSSFCLGKNDRNWKADIEFLSRSDTHARILEGKYDDKGQTKTNNGRYIFNEAENRWYYEK